MSNSSKLYNTLKTIDDGRKDCITALNAAGANLPDTANFASIAANIEANVNVDPLPYPMPGVPMKPEDDPEMPEPFPEDYPDFEKILKSKKEIEVDGLSYYPGTIVVFQTDLPTTKLFVESGSSEFTTTTAVEKGEMRVGSCHIYFQPQQTKPYYNTCKYVETSDGCTYTFGTTRPDDSDITRTENKAKDMSYVHAWDTNKDITLSDGSHLKYIIIYYMYAGAVDSYGKPNTSTSYGMFGSQQSYGTDIVEIITCAYYTINHSSNVTDASRNSGIWVEKPYKRFKYIVPFTKNGYWSSGAANTTFLGVGSSNKMEQMIIRETNGYPMGISSGGLNMRILSPYLKSLQIDNISSPVALVDSSYPRNSAIYNHLIYLKVNWGTKFKLPCLKYLYVNPEQQEEHTVFIINLPTLRDTNLFSNIKDMNLGEDLALALGVNHKTVNFEKLESIGISNTAVRIESNIQNLIFPKLKVLNFHPFLPNAYDHAYWYPNIISLPSVEEIRGAGSEGGLYCRCLLLPKLKDVSQLKYNSSTKRPKIIEYLDISGCEMGYLNLSGCSTLNYIKFPEVITLENINITGCYNLSHDFLTDMFNRLTTVEDDLTHTLTLGADLKYLFTDEELAIVTNKGWTLK